MPRILPLPVPVAKGREWVDDHHETVVVLRSRRRNIEEPASHPPTASGPKMSA